MKFGQFGLGHAEMRCPKRFPNFFATGKGSGIVASGFMAKKISESCSFSRFRRFAPFHKGDRRIALRKKQYDF
jgi:hypothetical protein